MSSYVFWTIEKRNELQRLASERLSASQIARELNIISRNAVIGACHRYRIKLAGAPGQGMREPRLRKPKVRKPYAPPKMAADAHSTHLPALPRKAYGTPCTIIEVCGCRWPVEGEGYSAMFCNGPQAENSSYCEAHKHESVNHYFRPNQLDRLAGIA